MAIIKDLSDVIRFNNAWQWGEEFRVLVREDGSTTHVVAIAKKLRSPVKLAGLYNYAIKVRPKVEINFVDAYARYDIMRFEDGKS